MANIADLETLRPLGKLEQVSASCHHLGFFNNVGVSAHYGLSEGCLPVGFDLRRVIYTAVGDVLRSHRILFAVPVDEDSPTPYFASLSSIDLDRSICFLRRSQPSPGNDEGEDKELDAILEDQHNTNFKTGYGALPFWRLVILQTPESEADVETEFTASFIYHHAIGDGVSGLVFHSAFRSALLAALSPCSSSSEIQSSVEPRKTTLLLPPVEELHPEPIHPNPPGPGITAANIKEWTGNSIHTPCKSRWASFHLSPAVSDAFFLESKENNASVTSALSSVIASVLFDTLPPSEELLTCIIPISLRPWLNVPRDVANGAIGTYFDATRVRLARADGYGQDDGGSTDIWPGARNVSKAIKDYLCNVSPSGEPYTAIAVLKSIPDFSVICKAMLGGPRDAAFEVTNIGLFSSPTQPEPENSRHLCRVGRVTLSRSALASGAAVTASIATGGNGSMTVGFSWQDGVVEDDVIQAVCKGVRRYFEKYTCT